MGLPHGGVVCLKDLPQTASRFWCRLRSLCQSPSMQIDRLCNWFVEGFLKHFPREDGPRMKKRRKKKLPIVSSARALCARESGRYLTSPCFWQSLFGVSVSLEEYRMLGFCWKVTYSAPCMVRPWIQFTRQLRLSKLFPTFPRESGFWTAPDLWTLFCVHLVHAVTCRCLFRPRSTGILVQLGDQPYSVQMLGSTVDTRLRQLMFGFQLHTFSMWR